METQDKELSRSLASMSLKELREYADRADELGGLEQRAALEQELYRHYRSATDLPALIRLIGQWRRRKGFSTTWADVPLKLMLIVTELAEAMEAYRHFSPELMSALCTEPVRLGGLEGPDMATLEAFEEEIADTFIRITDLCEALKIDLLLATCRKMAANELRPHKHGKNC